jgi:hypothetical protein
MKTNSRMIVLLMTMVSANVVYGQTNELPNGNFDPTKGISGWTAQGNGSIGFSSNDADAASGGSMELAAADPNNPETATSTCFSVTPGASFVYGGKEAAFQTPGANSSSANFQCHSFTDSACKAGQTDLGTASLQSNGSLASFSNLLAVQGVLANAQSVDCTVTADVFATGMGTNQSDSVVVDDLYFYSPANANGVPLLGGYLSGSWYDPTTSGQGFELEFTAQANTLLATWFTYSPDNSGTTQWIYGQGTYDPTLSTVTIPAVLTSGTSFSPNFIKANVKKTPWGNLTFTFTDCDHATMSWSSTLPGYGGGTQQLQRLTSIAGLSCPQ